MLNQRKEFDIKDGRSTPVFISLPSYNAKKTLRRSNGRKGISWEDGGSRRNVPFCDLEIVDLGKELIAEKL